MPYDQQYGVFHEEPGLATGSRFNDTDATIGPRHRGKQIIGHGHVSGKGSDAMIDKSLRLTAAGDMYIGPAALQQMLQKRSGTPVSTKPFTPSHIGSTSAGKGSLYGAFGPSSLLVDTDATLGERSGRPASAPVDKKRNFTVSPPKKGGSGFPFQDRTIGGTRFEHQPDEYARGRLLDKELRKTARAKFTRPFVASARSAAYTGCFSSIYLTSAGGNASPMRMRPATTGGVKNRAGWRPSNPPQKGPGHGCITPLVYVPSPCIEATFHGKGQKAVAPFKPASGPYNRLSMWAVNPYSYDARPPPDNDFTLL